MKKIFVLLLLSTLPIFLTAQNKELQVKEYMLKNGLKVWLNEDHSAPKVVGAMVVRAGAKDCPDTGIAHYFEHIMFKGTDKIGAVDYAKEKPLLDSIALQYDLLASTTDELQRKQIQKKINELSTEAGKYVIPNEFMRLISHYGGSGLNAYTSHDVTVYFNTFSPQYMAQWAELNSERLIDPVFRMFQGELETVYEEKNMSTDRMGGLAFDYFFKRYFSPSPYAYTVLGSAENLKNPKLSDMKAFFEKYYVATNMGLIISGDFKAEEILSVLEKTFGRIRRGQPVIIDYPAPAAIDGREQDRIKLPIPIIKGLLISWRGVPLNSDDEYPLQIALNILSNSNETGYLDELAHAGKYMEAAGFQMGFQQAGILAVGALLPPTAIFASYSKAEKTLWEQIRKVQNGEFSDDQLQSLKLALKRDKDLAIEDVESRVRRMIDLIAQGKGWEDYLQDVDKIDRLTKQDIMDVAKRYFNDNYIVFTKKTGDYPKQNVAKPGFAPIVPPNKGMESEYAKQLAKMPVTDMKPRFVDVENDVQTIDIAPNAKLFAKQGEINQQFSLQMVYGRGSYNNQALKYATQYVSNLGTDSLSYVQLKQALQKLGTTMNIATNSSFTTVYIMGLNANFEKSLVLFNHFMSRMKGDDKQLKKIYTNEKADRKSGDDISNTVSEALTDKILYGEGSVFLKRMPLADVKKLKHDDLIDVFSTAMTAKCDIMYSGPMAGMDVAQMVKQYGDVEKCTEITDMPMYRDPVRYSRPTVFFVNDPKVTQSIIQGYIWLDGNMTNRQKNTALTFSTYLGRGMLSLMFQEIREFRSFAYRAYSDISLAPPKRAGMGGYIKSFLSTQSDKTIEAMNVFDSLIRSMDVVESRFEATKQITTNAVNNQYPSFREMPAKVAAILRNGYHNDPNIAFLKDVQSMDVVDLRDFYEKNIKSANMVYIIMGNAKKISMKDLERFGEVVKIEKKDLFVK